MSLSVLVVEDEDELREEMVGYLGLQGYEVTGARNAAGFRSFMADHGCDLVVLDIGLPDADGLGLISEIPSECGVVLATGFGDSKSRLAGREAGADDYVVKPFTLPELAATVRNLLSRLNKLELPPWQYDALQWILTHPRGEKVKLTHLEAVIFVTLTDQSGAPVPREALCLAIGENPEIYDYRRLETLIRRLRAKAESAFNEKLPLTTVHGVGYAFTAPCKIAGASVGKP
ncbi:DNA-binding response regulator, OmpR family, contains REC and winged-helix (wHTH) domain [Ectothiorhodosinus mongolicus]|uniref:DNA-binding response regulator, OmpR family, contains REC and winged-helix (WHTH) domain n=1 Tax=Ectothiorhodosinus mongolicus TaxID=233100 RepID=A0A1R3VM87_9GAMM|nr:response regulator transcription factor [Ectothiorhodosinus mongolicus]ULX57830.1 DNA-binding response regulator [Ectothiorhodosinus mongolicus]SIT65701.1 DNA-binding response regulator, OmpR family, contains REC and winged-helix (wHTH) domain [Ectothiorhodosinus mongolicus]